MINKIKTHKCLLASILFFIFILFLSYDQSNFNTYITTKFIDVMTFIFNTVISLSHFIFDVICNLVTIDSINILVARLFDFLYGYMIIFGMPMIVILTVYIAIKIRKSIKDENERISLLPNKHTKDMERQAIERRRVSLHKESNNSTIPFIYFFIASAFLLTNLLCSTRLVDEKTTMDMFISPIYVFKYDAVHFNIITLLFFTISLIFIIILKFVGQIAEDEDNFLLKIDEIPNIKPKEEPETLK